MELDCSKKKWIVYVKKGSQFNVINNYFENRCDAELLPASQIDNPNINFKWTDYHY